MDAFKQFLVILLFGVVANANAQLLDTVINVAPYSFISKS